MVNVHIYGTSTLESEFITEYVRKTIEKKENFSVFYNNTQWSLTVKLNVGKNQVRNGYVAIS